MMELSGYQFTKQSKSIEEMTFLFLSVGCRNIIKAVHYNFVGYKNEVRVYNLGFGDYEISNDQIDDNVLSENGDAYHVFNTVLNTVPEFFRVFPESIILVRGSDSRPEFKDLCRQKCHKSCKEICKKENRRIKIYTRYINKNYQTLHINYMFFGGVITNNETLIEEFELHKHYEIVFIAKIN